MKQTRTHVLVTWELFAITRRMKGERERKKRASETGRRKPDVSEGLPHTLHRLKGGRGRVSQA